MFKHKKLISAILAVAMLASVGTSVFAANGAMPANDTRGNNEDEVYGLYFILTALYEFRMNNIPDFIEHLSDTWQQYKPNKQFL